MPSKSTFSGDLSGGFSLSTLNNQFGALFQGDSSPLRPRAQATPNMTVAVSASLVESYYSPIWLLGTAPLNYAGGNSGAISAPAANPRIDLLYITSGGTLTWITGSEAASPTAPSLNADGFPICYVYCVTTMTKIVNYEDKDANPTHGYIWKDVRAMGLFQRLVLVTQGQILYRGASILEALATGTKGKALVTGGAGADPSWEGMTTQGDIEYHNGTTRTRLTAGTSGYFLKTLGAGANPLWAVAGYNNTAQYFAPDSSCIVAFDHGSLAIDLSTLQNAITLTSLAETDLTAGLISPLCYNFDGGADYVLIAHHALQAGMSALTIECWFDCDAAGDMGIIATKADNYIQLYKGSAYILGQIVTGTGTEAWNVAHGLADGGNNITVYLVVTWDNASAATIYINGASVGNGNDAGNGTVSDSANGIYIGVNTAANAMHWDGLIDGVRILRRKMSAAEVLARYNAFA